MSSGLKVQRLKSSLRIKLSLRMQETKKIFKMTLAGCFVWLTEAKKNFKRFFDNQRQTTLCFFINDPSELLCFKPD